MELFGTATLYGLVISQSLPDRFPDKAGLLPVVNLHSESSGLNSVMPVSLLQVLWVVASTPHPCFHSYHISNPGLQAEDLQPLLATTEGQGGLPCSPMQLLISALTALCVGGLRQPPFC